MEQKIKSIEKGWGEGSVFFSTDQKTQEAYRVDEIIEICKQISKKHRITIYEGYKNSKLVFKIGACSDITIIYK